MHGKHVTSNNNNKTLKETKRTSRKRTNAKARNKNELKFGKVPEGPLYLGLVIVARLTDIK
ncbi:uncharacterized protein Dmoj_GI27015 [Drosophila mojavensis]|uniref:Uncharacterized protein n=1 Tax=Drosophila mojavensis TaxID=7230 RepID=A0A0Q9X1E2_DROMO|nr:uncharacterized protein Dmoj_GI27015 [Drosophila mojavensis]